MNWLALFTSLPSATGLRVPSRVLSLAAAALIPLALAACGDDLRSAQPDAAGATEVDASVAPTPPDAEPVAPPPGIAILEFALAVDVTPDGRTAVFEGFTQTEVLLYFHDTVTGESVEKTSVGDPARNLATGISASGRISALHAEPVQAGLYTEKGGWQDLGSPFRAGCDQDLSGAFDISADGDVAVGLAWNGCAPEAFRWRDGGGFELLEVIGEPLPGSPVGPSNRATVVSDDGLVAAGFVQNGAVDRSPAMWSQDGSGTMLDDSMDIPGEVLSISADGAVLAGLRGTEGFVWTAGDGFTDLVRFEGPLPSDPVFPNAIARSGTTIYGGVGDAFFGIPTAFTWSAARGMHPVAELAEAGGVELPAGLILNSVLGASVDGTVLIGTATYADFALKTFVLRVPASVYED